MLILARQAVARMHMVYLVRHALQQRDGVCASHQRVSKIEVHAYNRWLDKFEHLQEPLGLEREVLARPQAVFVVVLVAGVDATWHSILCQRDHAVGGVAGSVVGVYTLVAHASSGAHGVRAEFRCPVYPLAHRVQFGAAHGGIRVREVRGAGDLAHTQPERA